MAFLGGRGPEGAVLTAAIKRRTEDAPAEELIDSRRRQLCAEVRVERQEIGEYVVMCWKKLKHSFHQSKRLLFVSFLSNSIDDDFAERRGKFCIIKVLARCKNK